MKKKSHNEIIALQNEYHTSVKEYSNIPFFPSLSFYYYLIKIIIKGSKLGKAGLYDVERWSESGVDIFRALEDTGIKMHFTGMQHVRENLEPTIFISNHMSTLETMVPVAIIEPIKPVIYVIKKELSEYPVFKHLILATDPIIVGRENPREDLVKVLSDGAEKLKQGKSIILFPQKTRSPYFDVKNFNSLGIKLAKKNNVTVTPMAVLTDAWGNGKLIKEFGKIDVKKEVKITFGQPFKVTGNGVEENNKIIDFIKDNLTKWGRKDLIVE
ncbi:MAG: lysophospholipid acyltransferase family protein [bacterium]